jgi:FtsH-binding integral membrane protein
MSRLSSLIPLALAVAGGFAAAATFAFGDGTNEPIALGISTAAMIAGVVLARTRRAAGAAVVLVSAWTLLVSVGIFSGDTQSWLIFAGGAAVGATGLAIATREATRAQPAQLVSVPKAA